MQRYSLNSKIPNVEPSLKTKEIIERKLKPKGVSPPSTIDRSSPYLRSTARRGSKANIGAFGSSESSRTHRVSSGARLTKPAIEHLTRKAGDEKTAWTFVDSVISLCSKSTASCFEIDEPVPSEDMFLFLVKECGVSEAKHWARVMGFPHERSLKILEQLWYGRNRERSILPLK